MERRRAVRNTIVQLPFLYTLIGLSIFSCGTLLHTIVSRETMVVLGSPPSAMFKSWPSLPKQKVMPGRLAAVFNHTGTFELVHSCFCYTVYGVLKKLRCVYCIVQKRPSMYSRKTMAAARFIPQAHHHERLLGDCPRFVLQRANSDVNVFWYDCMQWLTRIRLISAGRGCPRHVRQQPRSLATSGRMACHVLGTADWRRRPNPTSKPSISFPTFLFSFD